MVVKGAINENNINQREDREDNKPNTDAMPSASHNLLIDIDDTNSFYKP